MPVDLFANAANTTLTANMLAGATSLTVTSSTPFPAASAATGQFRVIIDSELFTVTNVAGTTWTVTPGTEGTTQAAHASGAPVTAIVTAAALATKANASSLGPIATLTPTGTPSAATYLRGDGSWAVARFDSTYTKVAGTVAQSVAASTFTALASYSVVKDAGSNWDGTNQQYVVPSPGTYMIFASIRINDGLSETANTPANTNFGFGVHTSAIDGTWFLWHGSNNNGTFRRTTYPYALIAEYVAGDRLRPFVYLDGVSSSFRERGLQIVRIL